ncbi:MAG: dihydrodipicolinate synthase family protein [Flavobacteriales bacterium]|nr:dihydrodipicolinate synthase family protein [Flavobacteriales bacterium]
MQTPDWHGVIPAVNTHFNEDFSIDYEATLNHIDLQIKHGIHGMIALGTCGENNTLEEDEKIEILSRIYKMVAGRVPVIVGVSELSTQKAVRFAKAAAPISDGFMLLPPMAYTSDKHETVEYFKAVAAAAPQTPIMVYNCPEAYRVDVDLPILRELAKIDSVVCIKEATGQTRRITEITREFGDRFLILAGLDTHALELMMLGAKGWITGLGVAFPEEDLAIYQLQQEGRYEEALEIYRWYMPMLIFDVVPHLVHLIKLTSQRMGLSNGVCRPPRLPLIGEELAEANKIIDEAIATRIDLSKYNL